MNMVLLIWDREESKVYTQMLPYEYLSGKKEYKINGRKANKAIVRDFLLKDEKAMKKLKKLLAHNPVIVDNQGNLYENK